MEITFVWILSQIFTVVEYGLLGASYLAKNRKAVVTLDIASMTCGIVAFILLGADLGMAMSIIILLANFYYLWDESSRRTALSKPAAAPSQDRKSSSVRCSASSRIASEISSSHYRVRDYVVLVVVLAGIGVVTWLTYDGPLSLLSVAATVLYEISIWQKSTKVYKFLGIPVAFCWMTYNGFVKSPFGVLCEMVMFVTSIVGYVREVKAAKRKRTREVSKRKRTGKKQGSEKRKALTSR